MFLFFSYFLRSKKKKLKLNIYLFDVFLLCLFTRRRIVFEFLRRYRKKKKIFY